VGAKGGGGRARRGRRGGLGGGEGGGDGGGEGGKGEGTAGRGRGGGARGGSRRGPGWRLGRGRGRGEGGGLGGGLGGRGGGGEGGGGSSHMFLRRYTCRPPPGARPAASACRSYGVETARGLKVAVWPGRAWLGWHWGALSSVAVPLGARACSRRAQGTKGRARVSGWAQGMW